MKLAYEWDARSKPTLQAGSLSEARRLAGVPLRCHPHNRDASRIAIVRFVRGIGDRNPLWLGEEHAKGTRWGRMIAPPTWLYTVHNTVITPGLRGIHTLYAGASWEFYQPVRLGDVITAEATLLDAKEKEGRYCGRMIMQVGEVVYRNQMGEAVAKCQPRVMRCPRGEAQERGKYMGLTKWRYSLPELTAIENAYDAEKVQGAVIRYWEDVPVGETLTPVVKGPLTAEDMLVFVNATMPIPAFALAYQRRLRHPASFYYNPDTGLTDFAEAGMVDDNIAREYGFPCAHDSGIQRVAFLGNLVTNWMGDDGWLEKLNADILLPFLYGDTLWCQGKVTEKLVERGKHLVRCDVWAENQRREVIARGQATVSLLSRTLPK